MKIVIRPKQVFTDPIMFLAVGFGTGLGPKMPGTWGTLPGIPLALLLAELGLISYLISIPILFVLGVFICNHASKKLGVHDHGGIVWDEIVGYLITAAPIIYLGGEWWWHIPAFIIFRFFDVVKPWPIKWLDRRVAGGFGIMVDDVLAGLFGAIALTIPLIL